MSGPFLIDTFDGSLIVIPITDAPLLANLNRALEQSSTWGEFLTAVASDNATLRHLKDAWDEEPPPAEEPFDAEQIPGFAEGDWPTWPKQAMLDWLPSSVRALGTVHSSLANREFLQIDESLMNEVIEALLAEGIECSEDSDGFVTAACGEWRYQ